MSDVDRVHTLEQLLAWCRARGAELVEVIVQDEYTHDVVIAGPPPAFLVFDTT